MNHDSALEEFNGDHLRSNIETQTRSAQVVFANTLRISPIDSVTWFRFGITHLKLGNVPLALASFLVSDTIEPDSQAAKILQKIQQEKQIYLRDIQQGIRIADENLNEFHLEHYKIRLEERIKKYF